MGVRESPASIRANSRTLWRRLAVINCIFDADRFDSDLDRTDLTFPQILAITDLARRAGWIDGSGRLTKVGFDLLERLRMETQSEGLSFPNIGYYYPKSLRAPGQPSS